MYIDKNREYDENKPPLLDYIDGYPVFIKYGAMVANSLNFNFGSQETIFYESEPEMCYTVTIDNGIAKMSERYYVRPTESTIMRPDILDIVEKINNAIKAHEVLDFTEFADYCEKCDKHSFIS